MVTVSQITEKIIAQTPFLEEGLAKGLINLSALAREIKPQICTELLKDIKEGAIVMSLKRIQPKLKGKLLRAQNLVKQLGDMTVRSDLMAITFKNSTSLISNIKKLLGEIENNQNNYVTVTQGVHESTITVSELMGNKVKEIFTQELRLLELSDLSSITINLDPRNIEVPGTYYLLLKNLAWHNINIIDAVSTSNEITIIFRDNDIDKAFSVLKHLKGK